MAYLPTCENKANFEEKFLSASTAYATPTGSLGSTKNKKVLDAESGDALLTLAV